MRKGVVGRANWAAGRTWSSERGREWCTVVVVVPKSGASETLGVRGAEGKGTSERSDGGSVKGTCEIKELAVLLRRGGLTTARSGGSDCQGPRDAAKRGNDGAESRTNGNGWEPSMRVDVGRSLRKMAEMPWRDHESRGRWA
jgi:hypothetical protein